MKFDPFSWDEVKTNEETTFGKGTLRLRLSAPAALYVQAQGVEALAGYGAAFDVEVSEDVIFRVEAPKGVRAFREVPQPTSFQPIGEVFTNIDRMVQESGAVAEVTRARRQLEIERREMLREIRIEAAKARKFYKDMTAEQIAKGEHLVPLNGHDKDPDPLDLEPEAEAKPKEEPKE